MMKLKDRKIEIMAQVVTRDEHGIAATADYKEEVLFTINYRADINP